MDEGNHSSQSTANGQSQQRPVSHSRPFFYVQPPSQPYYTYQQWHANNPYNHFSFPGSGLHFGRTYFSPYSYMQYPGYVMPHAPVHLLDYRRMCDPHFNSAAYDVVHRQHHHSNVLRETTCSGAQTDPSDALNKLIECLDKLRASETSSERELDSGVVSQASGVCSPREEPIKEEPEEGRKQEPTHTQTHQAASGVFFSDAATAVCGSDTTQRQREGWSTDSDGESPVDTSSVHEKQGPLEEDEEINNDVHFHHCHTEKQDLTSDRQQHHSVCFGEVKNSSEEFHSRFHSSKGPDDGATQGTEVTKRVSSQSEPRTVTKRSDEANDDDDPDLPYRILRLPFGKVLSTGALQKNIPVKAPSIPPLSLGNPFYYSYCAPQLAQERLSVLSPSLDELSSRDEMFSTDLDDMDLFPGNMYTGGRRPEMTAVDVQKPALTVSGSTCLRYSTCTTCGLRLPKRMVTGEACSSGAYCYDDQADLDDGAVSEDDKDCKACLRHSRKKHPTCRALKCKCLQQYSKPKTRKLYCRERTDHQGQSECQACDHPMHKCCEELAALTERSHRHESREEQHRPYREKMWREGEGLHQDCRETGNGKGSIKAPRIQPLLERQVKRVQRRFMGKPPPCQNSELQNPADNAGEDDDEVEEDDEREETELL